MKNFMKLLKEEQATSGNVYFCFNCFSKKSNNINLLSRVHQWLSLDVSNPKKKETLQMERSLFDFYEN